MSQTLRLESIDEDNLEGKPVFEPDQPGAPALSADEEYTFLCHDEDCNFPVFKHLHKDAVHGVAGQCGNCGEYSYVPLDIESE